MHSYENYDLREDDPLCDTWLRVFKKQIGRYRYGNFKYT